MKLLIVLTFLFTTIKSVAQSQTYSDTLASYRTQYIKEHEVVKGDEKKLLDFYPANEACRITAQFEKIPQAPWFEMGTSGNQKQTYRPYGMLHFTINNKALRLNVYQSKDLIGLSAYADYLFIPFTDSTNGAHTYENGRYIDLRFADIKGNTVEIDFNKAYNPYCAYVKGVFNCPIPPPENDLTVSIEAGEKKYRKNMSH